MATFDTFRADLAALAAQLDTIAYDVARANYAQLQKTFELELSALPQHEQKLANRELHDVHKKIEKRKPKKSFALKKKTKATPKKDEHVEKAEQDGDKVEKSQIELIPIYADLTDETKVFESTNRDASLLIKNVAKCNITINGPCSSFTLENASDCTITLSDITSGAAMVRDASKCRVQLTSRQLRICNCHHTRFAVAVCSKIALEESDELVFGPHPAEQEHSIKMAEQGMKIMVDSFKEINDFEWPDTSTPSPNWCVNLD